MTPEEWIQAWRQLDNGCTALFRAQACRLGLSDAQRQSFAAIYAQWLQNLKGELEP